MELRSKHLKIVWILPTNIVYIICGSLFVAFYINIILDSICPLQGGSPFKTSFFYDETVWLFFKFGHY